MTLNGASSVVCAVSAASSASAGFGASRPGCSAANTVPTRITSHPTVLRNEACDEHMCASARVAGNASASYLARRCASNNAARLSSSVGSSGGSSEVGGSLSPVPPSVPSASAYAKAAVFGSGGGIAFGASSSNAKSASRTFALVAFSARRGFACRSAVFSSASASRMGANASGATGVSSSGTAMVVPSLAAMDLKSTSPSRSSSSASGSSPSSGSFVASAPVSALASSSESGAIRRLRGGFSFGIAAMGATRAQSTARQMPGPRGAALPRTRGRASRDAPRLTNALVFLLLRETVTGVDSKKLSRPIALNREASLGSPSVGAHA